MLFMGLGGVVLDFAGVGRQPEQAAELLQIKASWLRKKATARAVPCTFVGKHLRFSPADLAAIVAAGARNTGADHR